MNYYSHFYKAALYASLRSFNEYDGVIDELKSRKIKVMGCVLDTAQWPKTLTPEAYAERVKNIVLHYKGKVDAWEARLVGQIAVSYSLDADRDGSVAPCYVDSSPTGVTSVLPLSRTRRPSRSTSRDA